MGILIGAILLLIYLGYTFNFEIIDNSDKNIDYTELEFQTIAIANAEAHNYSLGNTSENVTDGVYNCQNFSKALVYDYQEHGYHAEYCTGDALYCLQWEKENGNCRHAWVKVELYVESVTGKILNSTEYRRNYVVDECRVLS